MSSRYAQARRALSAALEIRRKIGISLDEPIAIFDAALQLGILVNFCYVSSLEGMWCKEKRVIILSALRPAGRRVFTCAHELAHAHFDHGTTIDELLDYAPADYSSPEEYLANQTAAYLLMPLFAVSLQLRIRNWNASKISPVEVYKLATFFGVGYGALVNHMYYTLRLIDRNVFEGLSKYSPKDIRARLCPHFSARHLILVDQFWGERPIDLEEGDLVMFPVGSQIDNTLLEIAGSNACEDVAAYARNVGVGYFALPDGRTILTRVSANEFVGFADYRFTEKNNVYGIP